MDNEKYNDAETLLFQACRNGSLTEAQNAVHVLKARVTCVEKETGVTPMHILCAQGPLEMVQWLVEWTLLVSSSDTPPSSDDGGADVPLMAPSVLFLLQACDIKGNTPLHYASANGNVDIIRALASGIQMMEEEQRSAASCWKELLMVRNHTGRTPADWARDNRQSYVAVELESWSNSKKNKVTTTTTRARR